MLRNKDFLVLLIRLFLGYIFFSAGICKLTHGHFGQLIGPPWLEEWFGKYGLGLFAQVIAVCQVIFGALLFSQRFSTLGAIMLVPMNFSILAVTISLNWAGTPYVNALFLVLNLLLLAYEYKRFQFLLSPTLQVMHAPSPLESLRKGKLPWAILLAALVTMLAAPFNNVLTNIAGLVTFGLTCACILSPPLLSKLEKAIVAQAIGNMVLMTLGFLSHKVLLLVLVNSGILLLLLLYCLWCNSRNTPVLTVAEAK